MMCKPGVDTVIIGARDEAQLRDNLAAATWRSPEEVTRLDEVSALPEPYPIWHQHKFGSSGTRRPLPGSGTHNDQCNVFIVHCALRISHFLSPE